MKYTPLDLSFISNQTSPQQDSIRNTAAMIMANAGWSKPSQATLKEIAAANKKAKQQFNSAHKQSFLSSVFDLLQTPLYGVANALDESLAGHQSDSNDSILEDVGKSIAGLGTGAVRGIGAGLRGSTGILDALPGIDINDEWQSDPTDKTHISDVMIRKLTGMSTANAIDPKNLEATKAAIEAAKNKNPLDRSPMENVLAPFLPDVNDPEFQQHLYRDVALGSIPADIAIDPLNSVSIPTRAAKVSKDLTEGLDAARAAEKPGDAIVNGLMARNRSGFEPKAGLGELSPVDAIQQGGKLPEVTSGGPELPASVFTADKSFKTLANLHRRETEAIKGVAVSAKEQKYLVRQIATMAAKGEKGWIANAFKTLGRHPGVEWTHTQDFLQKAIKAIDAKGLRHDAAKMAPVLAEAIKLDVQAVKMGAPKTERRLMNTITDVGVRSGPTRLKVAEAQLANKTVRKFENEILGKARAPGTGPALSRAIAEGRNVRYSGPQQARMWNQITSSLKFADARKFDKAVRVLRSVEDYFISKGVIPHSAAKTAESVPIRLSQVAEAIGPQFMGKSHAFITGILRGDPKALAHLNPDQLEALNALRASEAFASAPAVQRGIQAGKQAVDDVSKMSLSVGRKKDLFNQAQKVAKITAASEGGGDVGAHVAGQYIGNLLGKSDPINAALNANRLKTEAWLAKNGKTLKDGVVNDPEFLRSVTNAITKASDLPTPSSLSGAVGVAARVADWLGARFNASYGIQDMSPMLLEQQASAMSTTARRAKLINDLGRRFSPDDADLWHEAFRTAQQNGVASGRVAELQSEIAKVMENLFGGTGLRSGAISDSTVVGRNRLLLDELNSNLKRFGLSQFAFTAGKVKLADGTTRDLSKGIDWLKSWETWKVTKPYEFLHKVQNVVEYTVREKNMFDEIASRFGSPNKLGEVKYAVDHPRLRGFYFNAEAAKQAQTFVRMVEEISTPNSKAWQYFDHVLSKIKAGLTIYGGFIGHQMTNFIGSTYFNWIAGVNKPIRYEQAIKTMLSQKGRYGDFASFEKLAGPKALEQAVARSLVKPDAGLVLPAQGNKVVITMQNGTKVTADMIYTAAFQKGILPSAKVLEDVESGATSILDKFKPLGGRGQRAVHSISEVREHIPRLALFIDRLAKSKGSFAVAVEDASRAVRKWHPDGMGFTPFEKKVMKRIFPFYSWTRKAIPLAIEASLFAGPKVMAYPRLMEAIGLANGVDPSQQITDPFPADQMFPDWMRNRGIGPVFGSAGGYTLVNPSTPILDVLSQVGEPGETAINMLNPIAKVPVEVAQHQTLGSTAMPLQTNQQWMDYLTKQVPVLSSAGRVSGQIGVSDSTRAEGFPNWANLINLLTGAKMVNTGKYQKSAQFDLRDYLKQKGQQQGR